MFGYSAISCILLAVAAFLSACHADPLLQQSNVGTDKQKTVQQKTVRQKTAEQSFIRLKEAGLPNAIQVRPDLISGGQPSSTDGFRSLAKLGIKTIVSVDGICPDLNSAKGYGFRYIHQPLGYQGISADDTQTLAHIILKFDAPIYIHCHHGQHRSPAAAAAACVTAGLMTNERAVKFLKKAGTGSEYQGLFKAVADAKPIPAAQLIQLKPTLPERADVAKLVDVMVQLDKNLSQLNSLLKSPSTLSANQRSVALERATVLHDHFTELIRSPQHSASDLRFRKLLLTSQKTSEKIRQFLKAKPARAVSPQQTVAVTSLLKQVSDQCNQCHGTFRH
ncbi:MAG: hypothetical protein ABJZ55_22835 [Fuerstiella sp.]